MRINSKICKRMNQIRKMINVGKMFTSIFVVLYVILPYVSCGGNNVEITLETENFVDKSWTVFRPTASGNLTTRLMTGKRINFPFCLRKESAVLVKQVFYSNDGPKDLLSVQFDGNTVVQGEGYTYWNGGNHWSVISSMNLIGGEVVLKRGRHIMTVFPEITDPYGVELDKVVLLVNDGLLTEDQFHCNDYCLPSIPDHGFKAVDNLPSGRLVQRSSTTNCTETQNIIMDLYHPSVQKFRITAQHPAYRSLLNVRTANRTNCKVPKRTIWEFGNLTVTDELADKNVVTEDGSSSLRIRKDAGEGCFELNVQFNITAELDDITVSDLGGSIVLKLAKHHTGMDANTELKNKNGVWEFLSRQVVKSDGRLEIPIADRTWSHFNDEVKVRLCGVVKKLDIESLKLTRRELKEDTFSKVADNGDFAADAVLHDMWWMGAKGMKISVVGQDITSFGHYLRIYTRVPWGGYSQTFVIYQDGVIRLLPPTMHGADWIPFGSSFLVGRFDPEAAKNSAEIEHIEINPDEFRLLIYYADGNIWDFKLCNGLDTTKVDIDIKKEGVQTKSEQPFLQLRSMFVKDGRSNVDRMSINGLKERRILDNWSDLFGSSFFFYRGCASNYHTQAPDMHVELVA